MYAGWTFIAVLSIFCGKSLGIFWPFTTFAALSAEVEATSSAGPKRVAIIGAGAGGSSAAYHLRKFATQSGVDVDITVYEKASYIGGRSTTVNAYNNAHFPVEVGGSIFVATNEILKNFTIEHGLRAEDSETEYDDILGIWDGLSFVHIMKDSGWQWWDNAKLLWKYGMAPIKTVRLMRTVVGKFKQLYSPPFFPFRSLSDRVEDLGLLPVTGVTGEQYLKQNGITGPFTTDIIQASTRVNYGQNLGVIHGLETMVCMAIEGAMSVKGGNWQIFDGMLNLSNATVNLNTTVNAIAKVNNKYALTSTTPGKSSSNTEHYDTVILAAPYQFSHIDVEEGLLKRAPDKIPYVTLHVTLFASNRTFSPRFFGLDSEVDVPTSVITTLPPGEIPARPEDGVGKAGFFSMSALRSVTNPVTLQTETLYKIFSPSPVTPEFLTRVFDTKIREDLNNITASDSGALTWYYPHVWQSYPYEYPRVTFEDSELARGFYYTSGMDSFISTMETNALMGMNIAQLVADDYQSLMQDNASGATAQIPMQVEWKEDEL